MAYRVASHLYRRTGDGVCVFSKCEGDINRSGAVDPADLAVLLGTWGECSGCPADLNGDDEVDPADLAILLGNWGPCP